MEKTIYAKEYRLLLEWLRHHRKRKGLTMRDLAKRLHVHHSWIGRVEQGERRLDVMEYARLCDTIGCDAGEGLHLVAPPTAKPRLRKGAESHAEYRVRRSPRSNAKTGT